ncbi:ATP synthase A chain [Dehalogenimonas sp. WBC-2]|nr:ATP synthase A chain [Dehalogenimonas sp. WBC-2]
MPETPKKKIIGLSKPVFIAFLLVLLALSIVSLLGGAIGRAIVGDVGLPDWVIVDQPHPELPAEAIAHVGSIPITNTMLAAWISMAVLGIFFFLATRKMKLIPGRLQATAESIINYLYGFCTDIAGEKHGRRFFPLMATIFLFVITNAWMNLIPGYGSILIGGEHGFVHLFRGANTDINFPLVLALVSFVMVEYWGLKTIGIFHYLGKFFNFKKFFFGWKQVFKGKLKDGIVNILMGMIDIFIGLIELLSEFIRILSFTFRLFGNMTGGEILLISMLFLAPFIVAVPFYVLEIFVGYIQALIFAGLTLVFAFMAVTPHEVEAEGSDH